MQLWHYPIEFPRIKSHLLLQTNLFLLGNSSCWRIRKAHPFQPVSNAVSARHGALSRPNGWPARTNSTPLVNDALSKSRWPWVWSGGGGDYRSVELGRVPGVVSVPLTLALVVWLWHSLYFPESHVSQLPSAEVYGTVSCYSLCSVGRSHALAGQASVGGRFNVHFDSKRRTAKLNISLMTMTSLLKDK